MSIEEARAALRAKLETKLVVAQVDQAMTVARPALLLRPDQTKAEGAPIGCTKVGGAPDLPEGFAWPALRRTVQPKRSLFSWGKKSPDPAPTEIDVPLLFVAQIDLAACPIESELDLALPKSGLLSFFYFFEKRDWISEFAPGLAGGSVLAWHPASTKLVRRAPPGSTRVFPELRLTPKPLMTFPGGLGWDNGWRDRDAETIGDWNASEPDGVRLGGWASEIQGPMEPECESGMNRIAGRPHDVDWKNYKGERWDWKLVLQIPSIAAAEMNWVSGGDLYVWMREADIRDGKFENAGTIVQFT